MFGDLDPPCNFVESKEVEMNWLAMKFITQSLEFSEFFMRDWTYNWTLARLHMTTALWPTNSVTTSPGSQTIICSNWPRTVVKDSSFCTTYSPIAFPFKTNQRKSNTLLKPVMQDAYFQLPHLNNHSRAKAFLFFTIKFSYSCLTVSHQMQVMTAESLPLNKEPVYSHLDVVLVRDLQRNRANRKDMHT